MKSWFVVIAAMLAVVTNADTRAADQPAAPVTETSPRGVPPEVIVSARRWRELRAELEPKVSKFVFDTLNMFRRGGDRLARWEWPLCPLVSGLPQDDGEFILARVSDVSRSVGAPLGGPGCRPNLYVLVSPRPQALVKAMEKRNPLFLFGSDAFPPDIDEFINTPRTVRVWRDTIRLGYWSRFTFGPRENHYGLSRVFVIVDGSRLSGVTRGQLADYIAMVGLTELKPDANPGAGESVLRLFTGSPRPPPAAMTEWDHAFLDSLYAIQPGMTEVRAELRQRMVNEVVAREIGPSMLRRPPADKAGFLSGSELEAARGGIPYRRFSAWLEAFNSGDQYRISGFLHSHWPYRTMDQEMAVWEQSGGFELRALQQASETSLSGFLEARDTEDFTWFSMLLAPDGANAIMMLDRRSVTRPPGFEAPRMSDQEIMADLRGRLERDTAADRFSGAVLVAKNGGTLFSGAYGLADRGDKVANSLDTRFHIASLQEMFTATAVLQLVQAGKINLADPVEKYIPDYPNHQVAATVTIHHLLTHTGGTGDIFGPYFAADRLKSRTLEDYLHRYGERNLHFEPESHWEYSNFGMVLLGVVIERVSGQSYYDYVAQNIFRPAGMTRTGSEPENQHVPGRSIGYMRVPGSAEWKPNADTLPYRGTSAGGGYSTVGDLVKFADALLSNRLLDAQHTQLLITGKVHTPSGALYAYGFEDSRKPDGTGAVGDGGNAPGMSAELRIFPGSGYVVAVLSNLDGPAAQRVCGFLMRHMAAQVPQPH
jgi:D-alanyl-D-alanine carboxypeptidase